MRYCSFVLVGSLVLATAPAVNAASPRTRLVSKTSAGAPAGLSYAPDMTPDGRFVAFVSEAANLPGGGGGLSHVYVHDRKTGKTRLVSKSSAGTPGDDTSSDPSISGDGRFVAFESDASNFPGGTVHTDDQIYVHDRKSGRTVLVSRSASGAPANAFSGVPSSHRVMSNGGAVAAFSSEATNLPGGSGGPPPGNSLVYARGPLKWPR